MTPDPLPPVYLKPRSRRPSRLALICPWLPTEAGTGHQQMEGSPLKTGQQRGREKIFLSDSSGLRHKFSPKFPTFHFSLPLDHLAVITRPAPAEAQLRLNGKLICTFADRFCRTACAHFSRVVVRSSNTPALIIQPRMFYLAAVWQPSADP